MEIFNLQLVDIKRITCKLHHCFDRTILKSLEGYVVIIMRFDRRPRANDYAAATPSSISATLRGSVIIRSCPVSISKLR
jgi:hypothetical protein